MKLSVIFCVFATLLVTTHAVEEEKHQFQAEVTRMMKLIINSLYTNKEIFLRELISNASDALDKIRVLALTNKETLGSLGELDIRIRADDVTNTLQITDTGIGMTRKELIQNLGTIAKSGTSEFLKQNLDSASSQPDQMQLNDLIGQFGVGFYSSFLVADKVVVSSKSNDDPDRHIWTSNSTDYTISVDKSDDSTRENRGTTITLYLKEEAKDFLKTDTLKELIKKYSQFINFPIYLWTSKTVKVPVDDSDEKKTDEADVEKKEDETVDEESKKKDKVKKEKEETVWSWERINVAKPIWQRKPSEVSEQEYTEFYKSITRDHQEPLAKTHFTAEGELTFKSLLFIPKQQPSETFNKYGTKSDNIKLYVRRVFISDEFNDLMPSYLSFVRGVVDSDDLPLNVGRETLQQHKLLKVIKKKLVRKTLDMIKKIDTDQNNKYSEFWKEYSTNLKLGIIEDQQNRNRIAKLLRFHSSKTGPEKYTSLIDYVKDMPQSQEQIFYIAGASFEELSQSPFVESVLKKGYEVLYLIDAVDEYCISNLPEFDGKKFQNVAKEGLVLGEKSKRKSVEEKYKPLVNWLKSTALKDKVQNVVVSERLSESPAALVAPTFGWTGNMERLAKSNAHSKSKDLTRDYYLSQKKILEINPHHPLIKELLKRIALDDNDDKAQHTAVLLFEAATIRSGYMLQETEDFGKRVEKMMRVHLGVPEDAPVEEDDVEDDIQDDSKSGKINVEEEQHDEL